jgi:hypothetical protein
MNSGGPGFDIYAHMNQQPGTGMTCPLCRGVGGVSPHPELGFACNLCGGPRIPLPEGSLLDEISRGALRKAEELRKKRGFMRGLGIFGLVGVAFGLFVALPVLFFSFFYSVLTALMIAGPSLAIALWSRARAASMSKEMTASIDAAWGAAARELFRSGKIKSAADLAKLTGADGERAQQAFTLLSVDAEIGVQNVRIDAGPVVPMVPEDPRFAALEAKAEAEAAAEAQGNDDARAKIRVP